jgi:hypothetical protein
MSEATAWVINKLVFRTPNLIPFSLLAAMKTLETALNNYRVKYLDSNL